MSTASFSILDMRTYHSYLDDYEQDIVLAQDDTKSDENSEEHRRKEGGRDESQETGQRDDSGTDDNPEE